MTHSQNITVDDNKGALQEAGCRQQKQQQGGTRIGVTATFSTSISRFAWVVTLLLVASLIEPVSGKWYAQICPTGSVEAVTIDTSTGYLSFVDYHTGSSSINSNNNNNNNNNNNTDTYDSSPPTVVIVGDNFNTTSSSGGGNRSFLRRSLQHLSTSFSSSSREELEEYYESSPAWKAHVVVSKGGNIVRELQSVDDDNTNTIPTNVPMVDNYQNGEIFFIRPCLCYNGGNRYSAASSSSPDATTTSASTSTAEELYLCNAEATYCGVPTELIDEPVACYTVKTQQVVARNAWPLILLWYFGLLVICMCTIHGHTAGEYIKSWLVFGYNERFLDRMMDSNNNNHNNDNPSRYYWWSWQRQRFEQNLLLQVQWIWRHEEYNRERRRRQQGLPPPQLELKVKRWTNPNTTTTDCSNHDDNNNNDNRDSGDVGHVSRSVEEHPLTVSVDRRENPQTNLVLDTDQSTEKIPLPTINHDNEEGTDNTLTNEIVEIEPDNSTTNPDEEHEVDSLEEPSCTICFAPLEEGDRIGDLPCRHVFHVHCLKTWVQRKNACPLCNVPIGCRRVPEQCDGSSDDMNDNDWDDTAIYTVTRDFGWSDPGRR